MLFSEAFHIVLTDLDDWFDPILFADTKLFIAPFLIFDAERGEFEGSHAEIVQFFDHVFRLVAQSQGNPSSSDRQRAITLLELGEVHELCIGYSGESTRGAGFRAWDGCTNGSRTSRGDTTGPDQAGAFRGSPNI